MELLELALKYLNSSDEVKAKIDLILKGSLPPFACQVEVEEIDQQSA